MSGKPIPVELRFWSKVDISDTESTCLGIINRERWKHIK